MIVIVISFCGILFIFFFINIFINLDFLVIFVLSIVISINFKGVNDWKFVIMLFKYDWICFFFSRFIIFIIFFVEGCIFFIFKLDIIVDNIIIIIYSNKNMVIGFGSLFFVFFIIFSVFINNLLFLFFFCELIFFKLIFFYKFYF